MKATRPNPFAAIVTSFALLLAACAADAGDEPPNDPPDTATTQLVFVPPSSPSIRFASGSTSVGPFDLTLDTSTTFRGMLAPVGPVGGLGEITTVPTSGFVAALAAEVGDGYVVRSGDGLGTHYRVLVEADIVNTEGGIIGKKIRWAPLSLLASMVIAPASPTVIRPPPPTNGDNCSINDDLILRVDAVTYTDGRAGGQVTSSSLHWTSDGPGFLNYDFVDERTGRVTVSGGENYPGNPCPPTRIYDYNVWVQAEGNPAVASTVVKVRT